VQAATIQLEHFNKALTSTLRSISGLTNLDIEFTENISEFKNNQLRLAIPSKKLSTETLSKIRGEVDELALTIRFHDKQIFQTQKPSTDKAIAVYSAMERARISSIGANLMAGVAANLYSSLAAECRSMELQNIDKQQQASAAIAVGFYLRQKLSRQSLPASAKHLLSFWFDFIEQKIGHQVESLSRHLYCQNKYSQLCLNLIEAMEIFSGTEKLHSGEETSNNEVDEHRLFYQQTEDLVTTLKIALPIESDQIFDTETEHADNCETENTNIAESAAPASFNGLETNQLNRIFNSNYQIYTRQFDEVVRPKDLVSVKQLQALRLQLDQLIKKAPLAISKLANRLQRKLLAQQKRSWKFNQDEGLLDTSRLSNIIIDPLHPLLFKQEKDTQFKDTVITLLIDCSGSMGGPSIRTAAICADILGRTLERCAVKTEVLGFTTKAWRGGQSKEKWLAEGAPANPGRLNDLRHIIFKGADTAWRAAKSNLGLMLQDDLLKENIDGEALLWAHNRLISRTEERQILMVISDGLPVDNSTIVANSKTYLKQHLDYVIDQIENSSAVQLLAIGIGYDVTHHYQHSVTIKSVDKLAETMIEQLADLFDR